MVGCGWRGGARSIPEWYGEDGPGQVRLGLVRQGKEISMVWRGEVRPGLIMAR